jgi:SAM-dependent methyltransferase
MKMFRKGGASIRPYTRRYYGQILHSQRRSAKEIIPLVLELVHPKSVVDVGCGPGAWLSVFKEYGIQEALGIDRAIDKQLLQIPESQYLRWDLEKPLRIDRKFDLVISLEVAEHLPIECAETFVDSLVKLGPVILFSAAVPFQGGHNHINEQWLEHWANLFQRRNYQAIDSIRKKIWHNTNVDFWYAQNIIIYASGAYLENHRLLKEEFEKTNASALSIIHPKLIEQKERLFEELYSDIIRVKADLKRAIKDVEILQTINLGHQKAIEQKDAELKRAIKDVEILQRINLGHQKAIEQKDAELKRAIKDVEILQRINLGHQKVMEEPIK